MIISFKKQLFIIFILFSLNLHGQEAFKDTLKITIQQADSIFILQNLSLLSEKCNVDAAKAQIIQARLFKNITFSANQNVINTEYKTKGGRKWFDYTDKGETSIQIQKLFLLAGKRNKQIKLAEVTASREEQIYFDLIRTLKFSLRSTFYNIYYLKQILTVYVNEISAMNKLIDVYEGQFDKGYISKKELLRLKATLFSLENEKINFSSQLIGSQSDFNVLMHTSGVFYVPQPDPGAFDKVSPEEFKLQALIDTAYLHRYDLKMVQSDLRISELNVDYQKALATPDITMSAGWDRNGSYVHNYNYVGVQIDLPFFNRNQGNIKSAKFTAESNRFKLQGTIDQLKSEVISAFANAVETDHLYKKFDKKFLSDWDLLNKEMLLNFEKKNISLIEFLDYYDAYKVNAVQLNNLLFSRINSFENINFSTGEDIIKK
ncbi:MAG: TolC family protein [Bacteroidetes bacterium]|nr:MAG: TolC family protein [Bacteroidota bacterium]